MNTEELQNIAIEALNDLKGVDITTFDVRGLTSIADTIIICTGRSSRHVKSLAENIIKLAKERHASYIKSEGEKEGEWVLVDLGDVVVHIMQPATRAFYHLEDLWEPMESLREKNADSTHRNRD